MTIATLPQWTFYLFVVAFVVVAVFVLWELNSGQLVGSMECRWFSQMESRVA